VRTHYPADRFNDFVVRTAIHVCLLLWSRNGITNRYVVATRPQTYVCRRYPLSRVALVVKEPFCFSLTDPDLRHSRIRPFLPFPDVPFPPA
jgi:hypothetical protein